MKILPASNSARKVKRQRIKRRAGKNPCQPRTEARQSKVRSLTPAQKQSLVRWLKTDKVTYAVAQARLLSQFQVSLSFDTLSRFWHRYCAPLTAAQDVLLDVVIESAAPVRLIVKRKNGGITLTQTPDA
jgi:hypothetical protein